MTPYQTRFGSLRDFDKGRVEIVDDDPKNYVFSNIFEVAGLYNDADRALRRRHRAGAPLGMSGARRLAMTAVHALAKRGGRLAQCTLCVGVGQGVALALERV